MNKKGISLKYTVWLILILALIIMSALYIKEFFDKTKESVPEKQCAVSAEQEAQLNVMTGDSYSARDFASNVDCRWVPVKIKGRNPGVQTINYMNKCWEMLGKGSLKLFSSGKFCHICYVITYEPEADFNLNAKLDAMQTKPVTKYDIPEFIKGSAYGIIFYYSREEGVADAKIAVRPFDSASPKAFDICKDAEFPAQRVA
jgi:hypothetical protein